MGPRHRASSAALAAPQAGIGDTIRISSTQTQRRSLREVIVAQELLKTMGCAALPARHGLPGCGRTTSSYFPDTGAGIQQHLRRRMPEWRRRPYRGREPVGSRSWDASSTARREQEATSAFTLPGTGERPVAPVYRADGAKRGPVTLQG